MRWDAFVTYTITIDDTVYVGSCSVFRPTRKLKVGYVCGLAQRQREHFCTLKKNKHDNKNLQEAYNNRINEPVFQRIQYFSDNNSVRTREEEKLIAKISKRRKNKLKVANIQLYYPQ